MTIKRYICSILLTLVLYAWFNYPGRLLEHQFGYGVVYQRSVIVSVNEHLIIVHCFVAIFIRSSMCDF